MIIVKSALGLVVGMVLVGCQSESAQPPKKQGATNPLPGYTPDPYATGGGFGSGGSFGSSAGALTIESRTGSTLTAYIGAEAYWVFTARFSGTASVPIQLNATVNPQPPNMTIIGQGSDTINIRWTPQVNDATTYQTGTVNITASGPGQANQSFSWSLQNNGGFGGGGGLGGLGGGGGGGLLAMLPAVIQTITSGGGIGDLFQRLLQGLGSGGGGTNPFGGLGGFGGQGGQGGLGALGAGGFGGIGGNAGSNFGGFNNNYGQPGAGQSGIGGLPGNAGGQGGFGGGGGGW